MLRLKRKAKTSNDSAATVTTSSQFCEFNGRIVHYTQSGSGPHVVLIHGIAASLYVWRFIVPELSKKYTVTAIDLPGFGFSSKDPNHDYGLDSQSDAVSEFLTEIGINEARLVGSSMGGAVALWMGKKHPERFKDIVTISPSTNPKLMRYFDVLPLPLMRPIVPLANRFRYLATPRATKLLYSRVISNQALATEETISAYLRPFLEADHSLTTLLKSTRLIADRRLPGELKSLQNRILVLWGEKDKLVPHIYLKELIEHIPTAIFETHPTAGHHSMEDDPEWVLEKIQNFFTKKV